MPRVKLPDGRVVDISDDATPEQMQAFRAKLAQEFPDAAQPSAERESSITPGQRRFAEQVGLIDRPRIVDEPENFGEALAGSAETTLRGVGRGFFGLGDQLAAAGNIRGHQFANLIKRAQGREITPAPSREEALAEERQRTDELAQMFPEANIAGTLTGAVAGIPKAAVSAAKVLPKGDAFARALRFAKGEPIKNIARASAGGAAAGAVTEANLGGDAEDIQRGAVTGAIAGPALGGLARIGGGAVNFARNVADKLDNAGFDALAKGLSSNRVKISPQELRRRAKEHFEATGRGATLAEILEPGGAQELRAATGLGFRSQRAKERLIDFAEQRRVDLQEDLAEGIRGGRPTTGAEEVGARSREILDRSIGKIRNKPVAITKGEIRELTSGPFGRALSQDAPFAFRRLKNAVKEGDEIGEITVRDADDIRQALNTASEKLTGSGGQRFRAKADQIRSIVAEQIPEFEDALVGASRRGRFREGVERGSRIVREGDTSFTQAARRADAPTRAGTRIGARTALSDRARSGAESARRTAAELAESSGLGRRLNELDPKEAERLRRLGRAELTALNSVKETVRGTRIGDAMAEELDGVQTLLEAGTLATGRFSGGFGVHVLTRAFRRIGIPPTAAQRLAEASTDPSRTDDVIRILERAGVEPNAAQQFARAMSRAGGRLSGSAVPEEDR